VLLREGEGSRERDHGGGGADAHNRQAAEGMLHGKDSSRGLPGWDEPPQTGANVAIFSALTAGRAALTSLVPPLICPSAWRPEAICGRRFQLSGPRNATTRRARAAARPDVPF